MLEERRGRTSIAASLLWTLLLAWVIAALAGCATPEEYANAAIEDARDHACRRDYERAHRSLDTAMGHLEDDFELLFEKAQIHFRAHEFDAAAEWYGRAAQADPGSWKALSRGWEAEFLAEKKSDEAGERVLGEA
ncbi:MAG TPA: hypothetical protein VE960_05605, partial [bacterium]|nr:hypothetical protein [bacterium]